MSEEEMKINFHSDRTINYINFNLLKFLYYAVVLLSLILSNTLTKLDTGL